MDDTTRRVPPPEPAAPQRVGGLVAYGVSECGPIRKGNEDRFTFDLDLGLFVVADGMGGHAAGEVASRLAIESIVGFMTRSDSEKDLTWPFALDGSLSIGANRLRTALHLANQRVFRAAASHQDYLGMGTTVVAALFTAGGFVVAHAGDSRVYEQLNGRLTRLTEDDSLVASLKGAGEPSADARGRHPLRNVLTNVVGGEEQIDVHVSEWPRLPGRRLLLCSDGVHGAIDDERIGAILATETAPRQQAERLVAEAFAAGGRDNATALVVADQEAA